MIIMVAMSIDHLFNPNSLWRRRDGLESGLRTTTNHAEICLCGLFMLSFPISGAMSLKHLPQGKIPGTVALVVVALEEFCLPRQLEYSQRGLQHTELFYYFFKYVLKNYKNRYQRNIICMLWYYSIIPMSQNWE